MHSLPRMAWKYLAYYLTASNGKGHGVHSPFVYDFIRNVLMDQRVYPAYAEVEGLRGRMLYDDRLLQVEDLGAGSSVSGGGQRLVRDIARHAAKPPKLGKLLYRIARYYRYLSVLELGTSLGISTAYLALGARDGEAHMARVSDGLHNGASHRAQVWTIEGAATVARVAAENLGWLGLQDINMVTGNFDDVLPGTLDGMDRIDLAFIDGNHRLEPTVRYFHQLMAKASASSILIFDDIHWSAEMEEAWRIIRSDPGVHMTIDLFFIGLVVLRDEFKIKQDFIVRF